ncbi:serine/threonine-protein kinase [Paenibacillus mendelii]|uniref:Serine/threonine-protein kinase n=1 Tax=Paenibacillus mendelii TaxID=206163 RepID=A0ABV6J5H2_9BACL|nr:serine/threonine-protein kinase [Paenibacillus mendelii]MCQ6560155.1 serine/threonine protein kinase [Paenibacillus mendelii]
MMSVEEAARYAIGDSVGGGRYRIVGLIGRGGMGEVYAAEDSRLQGKLRALKVNRPPSEDGLFQAEEAGMLMRLNHPNLPLIVDYFPPDAQGAEILVMDFIDGVNLQTHLKENKGYMGVTEVIRTGLQLCRALIYLHNQYPPIIHRDLKPTNVMIDRNGQVRLIDFGIARRYKAGGGQDTVQLGTPGFAAPEQEGARQSDVRTDIYGLGALLYYLLSGGRPPTAFSDSTAQLPAAIPKSLQSMIGRMLERNPLYRYPSMQETSDALEACLDYHYAHQVQEQRGEPYSSAAARGDGHKNHPSNLPKHDSKQAAETRNKLLHIVIASIAPGSGGTFVAITLAKLLGKRGVQCAAFEHPSLMPEWHSLLDCGRASQKRVSAYDDAAPDPRYARYREDNVLWHMLQNEPANASVDDKLKYRLMFESYPHLTKVTDVSAQWMDPQMESLVLSADVLLFVADPNAYKWTAARLAAAERIRFERAALSLSTYWLVNKDMKFPERSEWLSLLPTQPIAAIPQLPIEEWMHLLWQGRWLTSDRGLLSVMEKAFRPLMRKLFE